LSNSNLKLIVAQGSRDVNGNYQIYDHKQKNL
jgi:hypothetical protein